MPLFVFNKFFYYSIHCDSISNYIALELDGKLPNQVEYKQLKQAVANYVNNNIEGVDESHIDEYVIYICDKLLS